MFVLCYACVICHIRCIVNSLEIRLNFIKIHKQGELLCYVSIFSLFLGFQATISAPHMVSYWKSIAKSIAFFFFKLKIELAFSQLNSFFSVVLQRPLNWTYCKLKGSIQNHLKLINLSGQTKQKIICKNLSFSCLVGCLSCTS